MAQTIEIGTLLIKAGAILPESLGILAFHKLLGALGGANHRFDERDAQATFFELQQAVNGTARGSGDHVLQFGRVLAGLQDKGRCSEERLGGKLSG